jgi:uncharacterized membrane protein YphA (DoxX/SURF4 family)
VAARARTAADLAWALQILAAVQFFLTGLDKVSDAPAMVQLFQTVGFGQWLRYFTGSLELVGAALLLIPSRAAAGAALLVAVMIGAIAAHLTVLPFPPVKPIILLLMLAAVLWVRREPVRQLS